MNIICYLLWAKITIFFKYSLNEDYLRVKDCSRANMKKNQNEQDKKSRTKSFKGKSQSDSYGKKWKIKEKKRNEKWKER